jgi:hypothetical protein
MKHVKIGRIIFRSLLIILALLAGAVLYDLFYPRMAKMREFDPNEVARLETAMWRSYYDKKQVQLFNQLSELLRTQYHMPLVRSNQVAYYGANAAFAFKDGKTQADYQKALPDLVKFYGAIRKMSDIPFDVDRVARLELQWWIVHRERWKRPEAELPRALAELQSAIYGVPVEQVMEHGRLRAEAMKIRDTKAANETAMTEEDWTKISELLRQSWHSLAVTVKSSTNPAPPSNQPGGSH